MSERLVCQENYVVNQINTSKIQCLLKELNWILLNSRIPIRSKSTFVCGILLVCIVILVDLVVENDH